MNRQPITAFILAGGRSQRMGTDKALLLYQNEPLIHRPIRVCQGFASDVRIIGEPARYNSLGLSVIPDIGESLGPLSGISTALQHSPTHFCSILACDMPLMSPEFFRLMLRKLPGPEAVIMRFSDGNVEPLSGIYSSACLPVTERNLASGKLKLTELLSQIAVKYVGEEELREHGMSRKIFSNINTPEDLVGLEL